MQYLKKRVLVIIFMSFISLVTVTTPTLAQDPRYEASGAGMVFDFIILRPLGIAATSAGCTFFIVSLPFTVWSTEHIKRSGNCLIVEPAAYTFVRPLGDLDYPSDEE